MKRGRSVAAIGVVGLVGLLAAQANAAIIPFNFPLTNDQETPPISANSAGAATLLYNTDTQTFDFDLFVTGIELDDLMGVGPNSTPIHIHRAPPGMGGPIVVDLGYFGNFVSDPLGIRLQLDDVLLGGVQGGVTSDVNDNEMALFDGNLYVNVHTMAFPSGEIRGQIVPEPAALTLLAIGGAAMGLRRKRANV